MNNFASLTLTSLKEEVMETKKYILKISPVIVGILFLYTGLRKLWEGDLFYHTLLNSINIENQLIIDGLSLGIPIVEIITSFTLLFYPKKNIGLYISLIVLIVYNGYLINLLFFQEEIPCTCRTVLPLLGWYGHLYFTLSLVVFLIGLLQLRGLKTN